MGLFKKKPKESSEKDKRDEEVASPLPPAPSATHLALIAERETTATAHRRAEKAESAYRNRKRATTARTEYAAAKTHIKTSWKEGVAGTKSICRCAWWSYAILMEKVGNVEVRQERKALERSRSKRERMGEKMRRLEEVEERRRKEAPAEEEAKEEGGDRA